MGTTLGHCDLNFNQIHLNFAQLVESPRMLSDIQYELPRLNGYKTCHPESWLRNSISPLCDLENKVKVTDMQSD